MAARPEEISQSVVERAADGDAVALAQIVTSYHDDMRRVAVVVCGGAAAS